MCCHPKPDIPSAYWYPGQSNAFAISSKLGLPEYIIEDAKKNIDISDQNFEDLIANLETSRVTIEKEQRAIAAYKDEIAALKAKLETKQDNIAKQKEQILRRANEQASKILQDAKDFADRTIRDMNKLGVGDNKALEQNVLQSARSLIMSTSI